MKIVQLQQGSPEWHAHRAQHFNASDAPAMMGCSPYKTRDALLREMHTGLTGEVDAATQRVFDAGHRFEALARPLAEAIIGDDLYPCVGVEGRYSASFDGLTLGGETALEHKTLSASLADTMHADIKGFDLPLHYRVQMEHQCMVSGAERVLFMATKWSDDDTLIDHRHCWYKPDPALRAAIVAGWAQFERDLAAYVAPAAEQPKPVGATPETLPALRIEVTGMVTASNLDAFKTHALQVFAGINRELSTDQQFADAEATVKWCATVEERLAAAKAHALSQTESIDALFRTIDDISAEARRVRLDLDKLVTARKDAIRTEIADAAFRRYMDDLTEVNAALAGIARIPSSPALRQDIAAAMKGKRTVATLRDAADTRVAQELAALHARAETYRANHATLGDDAHLFPDFAAVGAKAPEDFAALVALRKAQAAEAARQKAERDAAAARAQAEREEAAARAAAAAAAPPVPPPAAPVAPVAQAPLFQPAPASAAAPTLRLGVICDRLGFNVTADFLAGLGFHAKTEKAARLYQEAEFTAMCDAIVAHVAKVRMSAVQPAALLNR